jgi:hypothetical protein
VSVEENLLLQGEEGATKWVNRGAELWDLQAAEIKTYPPLNAPTGFRTGKGVASANLREDV